MIVNCTNNIHKLGNLKPLLRKVECVTAFINSKQQQNRQSSSNDGDRINDEKFDNQNNTTTTNTTTTTSTTTDRNQNESTNAKHTSNRIERQSSSQSSSSKNSARLNSKSQFISIEIFGPKDARLPFPGNLGFAPHKYLNLNERKKLEERKQIEKQFKLIDDHNVTSKDCLTTTIEYNLNNYETNHDRQNRVIENVAYNRKDELSLENNQEKFKSLFLIKVYSSTQFLLNDVKKLFPKETSCHFDKDFVIISVYANPFSKMKQQQNEEDVNIKDEFVNLANSISDHLNRLGIWTNFIVPDSKKFYANLFTCLESGERFVNYGIEIENYDDCKFIYHINNAKLFIGSIFSNAKEDSVELNRILSLLTPL